jgi:uncharacterized protein YaaQ
VSKLLIAFVHRDDSAAVADALRDEGFRFTQVPSLGGFLSEPNSTFLLAIDDHQVDGVTRVLERSATPREVEMPLVLLERLRDWQDRVVSYGGATVLVVSLEEIIRV